MGTDASNRGIGSVLYQKVYQEVKYIAFAARALTDSEKGYGATKRELLAIVEALEHFRYYLFGVHFTLYTDHNALCFMFTQKHTNQMLNNWLEILLSFDFDVVHLPGISNVLPGRISRFYDADPVVSPQEVRFWHISDFQELTNLEHVDIPFDSAVVEVQDNLEIRKILVERAHLLGHFGAEAMFKSL